MTGNSLTVRLVLAAMAGVVASLVAVGAIVVFLFRDQVEAGFTGRLAIALLVLGLGLVLAVLFQVRFGLAPLGALRQALVDIRAGRAERLPEDLPAEIAPLVREVNALVEHNAALVRRSRRQAGNLAHALKNPLTVVAQEAVKVPGNQGKTIAGQAAVMRASIDRHLAQARVVGPSDASGAYAVVSDVAEDIRFSLETLYRDREIAIRCEGLEGLVFQGDSGDLEEMLGNLMDNACKWTRTTVVLQGRRDGERLFLAVADDGPGISEDAHDDVMARGGRLDERVAGSGLGLDIVRDISELYRGGLILDRSPMGGLLATLDLPAAL